MYEIWIEDNDTTRQVLLGMHETEPPATFELVDSARNSGIVTQSRRAEYKRVSIDGNSYIYKQVLK